MTRSLLFDLTFDSIFISRINSAVTSSYEEKMLKLKVFLD